jgi:hypothetical protein
MAKHSNVFYVYTKTGDEYGFKAMEKARACKNDFGLDLFRCNGNIYEGRTGCKLMDESELPKLAEKIETMGGIEKVKDRVAELLKTTGESPLYTRPDERKNVLFPPREKDKNIVLRKDGYGNRHYYFRFYNENGVELYTRRNDSEFNRTIYVNCEGFMLAIGQHNRLEERLEWLAGLEGGIKGEVERLFNECMADPRKWVDICFANILGRADEANEHNASIREAREQENKRRDAEREAQRIAEAQAFEAEEQAAKAEYKQALKAAAYNFMNKNEVVNSDVLDGKSLIMQLFREHGITVPLKTQGWIIKSLSAVFYNENKDCWSYRYNGNQSTVFFDYLDKLLAAIETKYEGEVE